MNSNNIEDMEKTLKQFHQKTEDLKLKEKWGNIIAEDYNIHRTPKKSKIKYKIILAIILLATGIAFIIYSISTKKVKLELEPKLQIAKLQIITNTSFDHRGSKEGENTFSSDAYNSLKEGDFNKAIAIYIAANSNKTLSDYDTYHLAFAYSKIDNFKHSINYLENLKPNSTAYEQEVNWLLALNYIETNQAEQAKSLLIYIINNGHYKSQKAKDLIKLFE